VAGNVWDAQTFKDAPPQTKGLIGPVGPSARDVKRPPLLPKARRVSSRQHGDPLAMQTEAGLALPDNPDPSRNLWKSGGR
jgi:hypothetical protein